MKTPGQIGFGRSISGLVHSFGCLGATHCPGPRDHTNPKRQRGLPVIRVRPRAFVTFATFCSSPSFTSPHLSAGPPCPVLRRTRFSPQPLGLRDHTNPKRKRENFGHSRSPSRFVTFATFCSSPDFTSPHLSAGPPCPVLRNTRFSPQPPISNMFVTPRPDLQNWLRSSNSRLLLFAPDPHCPLATVN